MNNLNYYCDGFLREITNILNLNTNFKFNSNNLNTKVKVNNSQILKLKRLCNINQNKRIKYNQKFSKSKNYCSHKNINWPYQVLKNYFNIKL